MFSVWVLLYEFTHVRPLYSWILSPIKWHQVRRGIIWNAERRMSVVCVYFCVCACVCVTDKLRRCSNQFSCACFLMSLLWSVLPVFFVCYLRFPLHLVSPPFLLPPFLLPPFLLPPFLTFSLPSDRGPRRVRAVRSGRIHEQDLKPRYRFIWHH